VEGRDGDRGLRDRGDSDIVECGAVKRHVDAARVGQAGDGLVPHAFRDQLPRGPDDRAGSLHRAYRVTAGDQAHGLCQSSATVEVPASKAGTQVRVVFTPSRATGWCPGTFRGQIWNVITIACPPGEACPAILPRPELVGRFSFRVTRG
jgi:hypothetical protein